jgi:peptidyl-prolyl isomerase E (cyclophilin E)
MTDSTNQSTLTSDAPILHSRRSLYVGGLAEGISQMTVRAAFIPFGPIKSVDIPLDYTKGEHKGFAFVEYIDADDAAEAIYNMDGAELVGKVLNVCLAHPSQLVQSDPSKPVWTSDEWYLHQQEQQRKQ